MLQVRYRLANGETSPRRAKLFLAIRPFQANPPQFLNRAGRGADRVAGVERARRDRRRRAADLPVERAGGFRRRHVRRRLCDRVSRRGKAASRAGWRTLPAGPWGARLRFRPRRRGERGGVDRAPAPSAAEAPGASSALAGGGGEPGADALLSVGARVAGGARARPLHAPPGGAGARPRRAHEPGRDPDRRATARRCSPGTRSYARSWIRDGAMIVDGAAAPGPRRAARDFLELVSRRTSSRTARCPAASTARGADPVPENDSHGEFIYVVAEYCRYTRRPRACSSACGRTCGGRARTWTRCAQSGRADANRAGEARPSSACCRTRSATRATRPSRCTRTGTTSGRCAGYKDAVELARGARHGRTTRAHGRSARRVRARPARLDRAAAARRTASTSSRARPSSATSTPTSTTIALDPAASCADLPPRALDATFERYWREFVAARATGTREWEDYTPYEWRNVGALRRASGQRERALRAARLLLRRPAPARRGTSGPRWSCRDPRDAALPRRHAARLGGFGLHPLGARPVRLRPRSRRRARARRGDSGCLGSRASRASSVRGLRDAAWRARRHFDRGGERESAAPGLGGT